MLKVSSSSSSLLLAWLALVILPAVLLAIPATKTYKILKGSSGSLSSDDDGNFFLIKAPKKTSTITVTITDVDFNDDADEIQIRDGRNNGNEYTITKDNGRFYILDESSGRSTRVVLPYSFKSTKSRVVLYFYSRATPMDFSFFYLEDGSETDANARVEGMCLKKKLSEGRSIGFTCDTSADNAWASSCTFENYCQANYKVQGKLTCESNGDWSSSSRCIPNPALIEECDFDDEEGISNCPFSLNEYLDYVIEINDESDEVDHSEKFYEEDLNHSSQVRHRPRCNSHPGFCKINAKFSYMKKCRAIALRRPRGRQRKVMYAVCVTCRSKKMCPHHETSLFSIG